jgi:uncharacterized glyoxalase superfamily protein PhnB
VLGFEVRGDVGQGTWRWITVAPAGSTVAIVLQPPVVDPTISEAERAVILDLVAKGNYAGVTLATDDLDGVYAAIEASGAEVIQEPKDQDYGVRDEAFRDPAGNLLRINQR